MCTSLYRAAKYDMGEEDIIKSTRLIAIFLVLPLFLCLYICIHMYLRNASAFPRCVKSANVITTSHQSDSSLASSTGRRDSGQTCPRCLLASFCPMGAHASSRYVSRGSCLSSLCTTWTWSSSRLPRRRSSRPPSRPCLCAGLDACLARSLRSTPRKLVGSCILAWSRPSCTCASRLVRPTTSTGSGLKMSSHASSCGPLCALNSRSRPKH